MFCFNDTATTEIYTLSLHDALPILLEFFSWPSIFALSMVLAALALVGTTLLVPTSKDPEHAALDLLGAVLSVAGISADRKSTRLNSSHANISYVVFCLNQYIARDRK